MVAAPTPADLAVQILDAPDAPAAVEVMADWLVQVSGAGLAARLRFGVDVTDWEIMAPSWAPLPPAAEWPGPERFRQHPFTRFHRDTGTLRPTLLQDAVAAGWTGDARTHEEYERLHLSPHQLTIPTVRDPRPLRQGAWLGWVLVSEEPLPSCAVDRIVEAAPTIVGADHHLGLLARLGPAPGPAPGPAAAPAGPDRPASPPGPVAAADAPRLTARERMVLVMLAQGRTAAGIAARLAISPRTVHKHQEHLYRKLGAVDRLSAVLTGQQLGLLPAPPLLDPVPDASTRERALSPSGAACSLPVPGLPPPLR
ncbi:helix-turn-helix domain-containing protein [Ornithinimicrobium sp. W1665]|uniref:helix-turn-helix domain-containing protein n=2 Tax=Ornithinimicrobium sp. W1665 TaxID=3416666 RepID=UPI003CF20D16